MVVYSRDRRASFLAVVAFVCLVTVVFVLSARRDGRRIDLLYLEVSEKNVFGESESCDAEQPRLHVAPARNWLNDPNGLHYDGLRYWAYFQHNPGSAKWGDISWGGASSSDLLHWQREDTILKSPRPDYETAGAWSGNALTVLQLVYSCSRWDSARGVDSALCTASFDGIRSNNNPVLKAPAQASDGWRDPVPFQHGNKTFLALGASLGARRGAILLVSIPDFKHIDYPFFTVSRRRSRQNGIPDMIECPDIARLDTNIVVLKISIMADRADKDIGGRRDLFMLGTIPLINNAQQSPSFEPFHSNKSRYYTPRCGGIQPEWEIRLGAIRLDCGDLYASQSFKFTPNNDLIYMAWIQDTDFKSRAYNGALSFPRRLSLKNNYLLYSLLPNLSTLRTDERAATRGHTSENELSIQALPSSRQLDLLIQGFRFNKHSQSTRLILNLPQRKIQAELSFDQEAQAAVVAVQNACEMRIIMFPPDDDEKDEVLPEDSDFPVRLIVDGSLVEWDIGEGRSACTHRSYFQTSSNNEDRKASSLDDAVASSASLFSSHSLQGVRMNAWRLSVS